MSYATGAVLGGADVVGHLKNCWTVSNYCINKAAVALAAGGYIDIKPVIVRPQFKPGMVRPQIDMAAYRRYLAADLPAKLRVCDMEWPADMDPTVQLQLPLDDAQSDLMLLIHMLGTNAASMKRLKINLSLTVNMAYMYHPVLNEPQYTWPYDLIQRFLDALVECTGIERLTIIQQDYDYGGIRITVNLHAVQVKVMKCIEKMKHLLYLDWHGNMHESNWHTNPESGLNFRKTICSYLPSSLVGLTIRDGLQPRMEQWEDLFLPKHFQRVLSNDRDVFPWLKTISMPSSFWAFSAYIFDSFVDAINLGHCTQIGFSDPFKLCERPLPTSKSREKLPTPRVMIRKLITSMQRDITVDLRGAADQRERDIRIGWAAAIPSLSQMKTMTTGDGYTTVTLRKYTQLHPIHVKVLI
jgi:hypothetical protein